MNWEYFQTHLWLTVLMAIAAGVIWTLVVIYIRKYFRMRKKKPITFEDLKLSIEKGHKGLRRAEKTLNQFSEILNEVEQS